ncbi:glycosyltransferase family 2 protein, partial [Bacteroides heparinolyticus]
MKVSVIIPVYNVSKYIERCLLSVLNQTWQDLEVILVNDCTPDDSMEIAERVVKAHPRGKDVLFRANEKNKGLSATRNLAIHAATGDYLFFLDSDDYLPLDSLAILSLELQTKKYDFVLGDYEITGQSRSLHSHKMGKRGLHSNEEILSSYSMFLWPRMACNILVNRNFLLSEELFFKERIVHEDDLWTFQLACKAGSAYFCNKTTYYYYTHSNSITGNPSLWNLQCRVFIVDLMYNYILSDAKLM